MSSKVACHDIQCSWRALWCYSFRLGGGLDATFFSRPESGIILHQPPPPCLQSSPPVKSKSCTRGALVGKAVPRLPWPPRLAPWICLQKALAMASPKRYQWLEGSEDDSETDHSEQTGPHGGCAFCLCPDIKALKESSWDREKQKTLSTVELSLLMR